MKLYYFPGAPSPRKVGMVIAEKGWIFRRKFSITGRRAPYRGLRRRQSERDPADARAGRRHLHYREPGDRVLLEQLQPEPNLLGRDAREQALVLMWHDIATLEGYLAVQERFRNSEVFPAGRALPGPTSYEAYPRVG